jgi:hypothetical protein
MFLLAALYTHTISTNLVSIDGPQKSNMVYVVNLSLLDGWLKIGSKFMIFKCMIDTLYRFHSVYQY